MNNEIELDIAAHGESIVHGMRLENQPGIAHAIETKYAPRELLHFNWTQEYPHMIVPFKPNPRTGAFVDIVNWYQREMGCNITLLHSDGLYDQFMEGIGKNEYSDGRYGFSVKDGVKLNYIGYFNSHLEGSEQSNQYNVIGLDPDEAAAAKHKARFNEAVLSFANESDPAHNYAIPHSEVRRSNGDAIERITTRLDEISKMHRDILEASRGTDKEELIKCARPGVVLRPSNMDGGFGNIFLFQNNTGEWTVKIETDSYIYDTKEEALEALAGEYDGKSEFTGMEDEWDYVMTRMVDLTSTPSAGCLYDERDNGNGEGFRVRNITSQIQDLTNTTVGGSSFNLASESFEKAMTRKLVRNGYRIRDFIKDKSQEVVERLFDTNKIKGQAHAGLDWVKAGPIEDAMIEIVDEDEILLENYGHELSQIFTVESNGRHTLLSGVTSNIARAVKISKRNALGQGEVVVNSDDIDALYEDDRGSFWVHDFVEIPHGWEEDVSNHIDVDEIINMVDETMDYEDEEQRHSLITSEIDARMGRLLTSRLLKYISTFNERATGQLVMIPRVDVYKKGEKFVCSVALGSVHYNEDEVDNNEHINRENIEAARRLVRNMHINKNREDEVERFTLI